MRMDSVPIPLPAALVDTSFSLIQVGLKTLVLSTVIDKVEVQIPEFHEALEGQLGCCFTYF